MTHLLEGILALTGLGGAALLWLRASRGLRSGGQVERFLDGIVVLCWLGVVLFYVLAALGIYFLWIAVGAALIGGVIASRLAPRGAGEPSPDPDLNLGLPALRDPWLLAALPVSAVAVIRAIKGMAAPPLAWDAMTVHLPKAVFWIQSGSLALPDFPDAWTYYRWFPSVGSILFSWVMLPFHSDLLLAVFALLVWLAIWAAGARLARTLGAPSGAAWLGGAAIAALPTVLVFMTTNYVDNLTLLFVLVAASHLVGFLRRPARSSAVLALAAAGLAAATKSSGLLLVGPFVLAIVVVGWRQRRRLGLALVPLASAALALPGVGYLQTWVETGSPLYPIKTPVPWFPFHRELADLFAGKVFLHDLDEPVLSTLLKLFWSPPDGRGHMNFGLGGAVLLVGALLALASTRRTRALRMPLLLFGASLVLTVLSVLSADNLALRSVWIEVIGRHVLPAVAPFLLCATLLPERAARWTLAAALLVSAVHFLPLGWSGAMTTPALLTGCVVAGFAALTVIAMGPAKRYIRGWVRFAVVGFAGVLALGSWSGIRDRARFAIYHETTKELGAFDGHKSHWSFPTARTLWPTLDAPRDKRIAVVIGRDRVGHNQFFYPLFGSRLQNRLVYVPITTEPEELELSFEERYARADPQVWLANLESASVDLVVGLYPETSESQWLVDEGSFEVGILTDLGVPWIAWKRDSPPLLVLPGSDGGHSG